jgi:hypothetical protein
LAAVCRTFRDAGARCLVLAYVIEHADHRTEIAAAIPDGDLRVIRLDASLATLAVRLEAREHGDEREWHLRRAAELTAIMARNAVGDRVVQTDDRAPNEIAREILDGEPWHHVLRAR